jgi:hypothetical protein
VQALIHGEHTVKIVNAKIGRQMQRAKTQVCRFIDSGRHPLKKAQLGRIKLTGTPADQITQGNEIIGNFTFIYHRCILHKIIGISMHYGRSKTMILRVDARSVAQDDSLYSKQASMTVPERL